MPFREENRSPTATKMSGCSSATAGILDEVAAKAGQARPLRSGLQTILDNLEAFGGCKNGTFAAYFMNEKPTAERDWRRAACGGKRLHPHPPLLRLVGNLMKVSEERQSPAVFVQRIVTRGRHREPPAELRGY